MKHFSEMSESALRVVDAAEGLIQERGYNGFSYDDVAKLVGIKKPSIHHHFATKGDLATTVAQRYTHRFREQLLRIEVQHAKAEDRLTAYATLFENTFAADAFQHLALYALRGRVHPWQVLRLHHCTLAVIRVDVHDFQFTD